MQSARTRTSILRPLLPPTLLLFLPTLCGLLALVPGQAHGDYGVAGSLSAGSEGGLPINRENPYAPLLELADSGTSVGSVGNGATGFYSTSITQASLSASTGAQNAYFSPNRYYTASAATATRFRDELTFTVPAGNYPQGVYIDMHLFVEGGVSGGEDARLTYNFSFGGDSVLVSAQAPAPAISDNITLTEELVTPGTTLNNPVNRLVPFVALVDSVSGATSFQEPQVATSNISGEVTCMDVPAGITWTSDSGAFGAPLCPTPAVPTLPGWAIALLSIVLVATALSVLRTERPEVA